MERKGPTRHPQPPSSRGRDAQSDRLAAPTARKVNPVTPTTGSMQALHRLSMSHQLSGSVPQITTTHHPAEQSQSHRGLRLSNQLRDRFETIKVLAQAVKKTELCDVTHAMLADWSKTLLKAVSECDDLVANLPTRMADMEVGGGPGGSGVTSRRVSGQFQRMPLNASHPSGGSVSPNVISPRDTSFAFPPLSGSQLGAPAGSLIGNMVPDTGSLVFTLQATAEPAAERMHNLALCVHMCLDAAARSINAERASICMPVRGVKEDLRTVCSVGFVHEDHHTHRPAQTSPESLCVQSGFMIVCSNGTNPPVELDMRSALAFFQDESEAAGGSTSPPITNLNDTTEINDAIAKRTAGMAVPRAAAAMMMRAVQRPPPLSAANLQSTTSIAGPSSVMAAAAGKGSSGSGVGPSIVTSLKSRYWSKIVCPIRINNTSPVLGVVTFLNKDKGSNNFSTDDETIAFGAASTLATLLARCTDTELLTRSFEKNPAVPPFPAHLVTTVTVPGSRTQFVYRTKEPSGGKDIRILSDGKAERLDSHTALMAVSDYIVRMQQSWKDAVLLNAELRRTHEERTRVVTSLLVRARTSELRNTVLEKERIALIPENDEHNAKHFRDYAQFKKHRHRLEELMQEDAEELSNQRRQEESQLRAQQEKRQRKYLRALTSMPDTTNVANEDDDDLSLYAVESIEVFKRMASKARGKLQRKDEDVDGNSDADVQDDLIVSPPRSPTSDEEPDDNAHGETPARVAAEVSPVPSEEKKSLERRSPSGSVGVPSIGTGKTPVEGSFDVVQGAPSDIGDAPSCGEANSETNVLLGVLQLDPAPPGVSVSPADDSVPSAAPRRASSRLTPGAVSNPSQQVTPSESCMSTGTSDGGGIQPHKRDRRASHKAKELLFGKEKLPPVLLE